MTSAARMRKARERRRTGSVLVSFNVPDQVRRDLVELGWLQPDSPTTATAEALMNLLNRALEVDLRPNRRIF